ncbi:MAG: cytochrome c biogenesis protein CcdA [Chloroflexi bacterium]|nr:cytochrome c biogenesis protein CcdA [Chloroflexota bacterium]
MTAPTVGLVAAFVAGLGSFLTPCVLPLVPAYISYLTGRSLGMQQSSEDEDGAGARWHAFTHGIAFILGFSAVFIALGLATSALGQLLFNYRFYLARIGGLVVILFGLHMTGLVRIPFLAYDIRYEADEVVEKGGYLASFLLGVFFSAGWSPCVGPVLGAILTYSLQGGSAWVGAYLLAAYSAGLAVPFLLAALSVDWVTKFLTQYGKLTHYVEVAMGVVLIVLGILLFMGSLERLSTVQTFGDLLRILFP